MDFVKRLEIGIEELLLIFLLLIEVLDFLAIIPPELEFVEKALSFLAIPYLFYKASITKVVFGRRERFFDAFIVVAWALLSLNKIVGFAVSASEEALASSHLYASIANNFFIIEKVGFVAGVSLLLVLSFLLVREPVERRCLLRILHEQKKTKDAAHSVLRFVVIYLVLLSSYLLVFSFAMEWLGSTVDAPLMMVVLLAYLVLIMKRARKVRHIGALRFLSRVSEVSEEFYERFITLFHERRTVIVALTGLLVLHLLADIGHFLIPYVTGIMSTWYFAQMGPGHEHVWSRLAQDLSQSASLFQSVSVVWVYLLNLLAVFALFVAPAFIWWHMYHRRPIVPLRCIWVFLGSVFVFLVMPVFGMRRIDSVLLMGVDITTQNLAFMENAGWMLLASLAVMGIFFFLQQRNPHRVMKLALGVCVAYFAYYLCLFFMDVSSRYISSVVATAHSGQYFVSVHLLLFFTVTIAFYVSGFLAFAYKALLKQRV